MLNEPNGIILLIFYPTFPTCIVLVKISNPKYNFIHVILFVDGMDEVSTINACQRHFWSSQTKI